MTRHEHDHDDDRTIGHVLSRREVLVLLGGASAAAFVGACAPNTVRDTGAAASSAGDTSPSGSGGPTSASSAPPASGIAAVPSCVVRPEQAEGPYFVDEKLARSDIRSDPSDGSVSVGVPLALRFAVSTVSANGCAPLEGALVDVWHCDALGVYSDVQDAVGKKFLRGYQVTDANGGAQFTTVYPGWYQGRAVHIHFKIRTQPDAAGGQDFTSQLYFDDAVSDRVHTQPPYAQKGQRDVRNDADGLFRDGGESLLLTLTGDVSGYTATFDVGLQTS